MKRLFVAIALDKYLTKEFAKYRDLGSVIPYLRWVPIENFHITLLYIGMTVERDVEAIEESLAKVAEETAPFTLLFSGIGYAPPKRIKDMVWGYYESSEAFAALSEKIRNQLPSIIIPEDEAGEREMHIHTTLARFKDRKSPHELVALKHSHAEGAVLDVSSFSLMESVPGPNGPRYRPLRQFALRNDILPQ